ncbi:MAG: glycosyltransferase [Desulfobacterium sp.]|nr:glycosyltransferase [Desulfobacterium sp.]
MKVLWFTNTACSAADKLNLKQGSGGGWLRSLEEEVSNRTDVALSICFYSNIEIAPFRYGNTQFYPVFTQRQRSKASRLKNRLLPKNHEKEELKSMLHVVEISTPDIIHVHGTENNFGLIQNKVNVPVVFSIQGLLNSISEKYFSGIPYSVVKRHEGFFRKMIGAGIDRSYKVFTDNARREKMMLQNATHIMGRTAYDRRITRVLAPKSHYYIEHEVLRPAFYEAFWNKETFSPVIQLVTTLGDGLFKGFETIASTSEILAKNTSLNFVWNIIGLQENSNTVKLVKSWKHLDFEKLNIKFHGRLNEIEMVDILMKSDIYCQTSHIDNSPNALSEAMILGMPCIATFAGGTGSLLRDGHDGILVQDGDPWVLAGVIIELKKNFQKAVEMSKNARKMALNRHDREVISNGLMEIYSQILFTHEAFKCSKFESSKGPK